VSAAPDEAEPAPAQPRRPNYLLHAALFLATVLTTTAAGSLFVHNQTGQRVGDIAPIADGLSYSIPLMLILLCHELGHYLVSRLHGVPASLPYFIPLPPGMGLGTMGAVIGMKSTSDRKKLIDIAAAGPLAGLAVTIPVLWYGLLHSPVGPVMPNSLQEGNSILYAALKFAVKGAWLPDGRQDVFLHPTAWAGWAGLLVTMINLLPIGQLDGGHIATAYFGNRYDRFADILRRVMPLGALAVFWWVSRVVRAEAGPNADAALVYSIAGGAALPWLVWSLLVSVLRRLSGNKNHPPVQPKPLPASRKFLFWVMVVVFVAVFMPVWSRVVAGPLPPPPAAATTARL
jgi:membrane-associated protease RseP (regulator of RpoE activity)